VPIGGYAERSDGALRLRGFVARPDGRELVADEVSGPAAECEALGAALAGKLKSRGATQILAELNLPPQ
jgi:hydroxymethylbilane synthase